MQIFVSNVYFFRFIFCLHWPHTENANIRVHLSGCMIVTAVLMFLRIGTFFPKFVILAYRIAAMQRLD